MFLCHFLSKQETNSFEAMADGGGLLPLGGVEESGGYKGSGLSTMVEILTGVLGGAKFGSNNRDWRTAGPEEYADLVSKMTHYTGWPKKNATTLIRNFNDILD